MALITMILILIQVILNNYSKQLYIYGIKLDY